MYAGTFVEGGTADQIFGQPRHPYTLGLLESVPAARRAPACGAEPDRRAAAEHARAADVVPLRSTLPLPHRALHDRAAAARRARARPRGRLLQPGRRGRVAAERPGEHGVSAVDPGQALVEVDDLRVWFPITSGVLLDRHVGDVKAVDGVTFSIATRRDGRARRRVGLRQVDARPRDPAPLQADERPDRVRRPGHHDELGERAARRCAERCRWSSRIRTRR